MQAEIASQFMPISLAGLNANAEMLTRLDNKYVMKLQDLAVVSADLADKFDILDIDGKTEFGYQTCYFDSPDLTNFFHHLQGRRKRSKVRTRHYLDADLSFLEVKLKTLRKITAKKRAPHDRDVLDELPDTAMQFIADCHVAHYGRCADLAFHPVIKMQYQRMTLVAHDGAERMTIDRALRFWNDADDCSIAPEMVIVETKSRFGRGVADKVLRRAGHHPGGSCSKYCIGLAALGVVPKYNKFRPAFKKLLPHLMTA